VRAADLVATCRGLAAIPVACLVFYDLREAAFVLFALAALSDSLDGWLARRQGATARGALLDPLADKVLVITPLIALVVAGVVDPLLASALIVREISVAALRLTGHHAPATLGSKLKTACEMCGIALLLLDPLAPSGTVLLGAALALALVTLPGYAPRRRRRLT